MGVALQLVFVEQQRAIAIINVAVLHNGMIKIMMYHFYFHAHSFLKFVYNFYSALELKVKKYLNSKYLGCKLKYLFSFDFSP